MPFSYELRGGQDAALARLRRAESLLERVSQATGGYGVEAIYLDEDALSDPRYLPDALYVNRGDPYHTTLLYDVRREATRVVAWGDWLEIEEQARAQATDDPADGGES